MSNIDLMIKWMKDREGKVTYSMTNRFGPNSYDCSSAVFSALIAGGFLPGGTYLGTTESLYALEGNLLLPISKSQVQRGDMFVSGVKGSSLGSGGHTGIFMDNSTIIHCTVGGGKNGIVTTPATGWMGDYSGYPVYYYRLKGSEFKPSKPKPFVVNAIVRLSSGAKVTTSWSSNAAIPSSVTGQYYKVERVEPMSARWDLSEYQVLISSYSNTFRAWVYEQDLALTSGAKYKKGQTVRLLSKAQYASRYSNRQAIGKNYLEEIFEIVDVAVTAESQSAFQYRIRHSTLGDIWVLEQDLGLWTSTHKVGDIIRLSGGAKVTTSWSSNSAIEPKYVNEFYKIERIEPLSEPKWTSNYQLLIFLYTNDFRKWVYEQDAYKPPAAKFKKEDQVILSTAAKKASKYWSQRVLESKYLGQQYKIVDVALTAESRSPYQYRLTHATLGDLWVLEQDIIKN